MRHATILFFDAQNLLKFAGDGLHGMHETSYMLQAFHEACLEDVFTKKRAQLWKTFNNNNNLVNGWSWLLMKEPELQYPVRVMSTYVKDLPASLLALHTHRDNHAMYPQRRSCSYPSIL